MKIVNAPRTFTMLAAAGLMLAAAAGVGTAQAAVLSFDPGSDFSASSASINFGPGAALYTFAATQAPALGAPTASVATGGTAMVSNLFGGVADFFAGSTIDQNGQLYDFSAFPTAAPIPNSAADDFIGLAFTLADGLHYGYAEIDGTTLVSYGFEQTPGASIQTAAVPEPMSIALLGVGLVGILATRTRRRTVS